MNNPKEIKELLNPTLVARYYLGNPEKTTRDKLWYKSPWRNERNASFCWKILQYRFNKFNENTHIRF